jgi:hypothetical protein
MVKNILEVRGYSFIGKAGPRGDRNNGMAVVSYKGVGLVGRMFWCFVSAGGRTMYAGTAQCSFLDPYCCCRRCRAQGGGPMWSSRGVLAHSVTWRLR